MEERNIGMDSTSLELSSQQANVAYEALPPSDTSHKNSETNLAEHFEGKVDKIRIVWRDLNYSILVKDSEKSSLCSNAYIEKNILRGVSGSAESGQLLAVMGPTGCGKTSLLNILASRCPGASLHLTRLTGSITVNGEIRDEERFRRVSAYVLQDDELYAHLTVHETFSLSAAFYRTDLTAERRAGLVDAVINELGLSKARDTMIGSEKKRGVSGGERRRASIGVQLISDPAVLFLDEPTSGLDSFQAQAVMESMKTMAARGRLVVAVIHQPRSSIFDMFDRLLLLSQGRAAYYGPASEAVAYFASKDHKCPDSFNPCDFFLDILSPDTRSIEVDMESRNRLKYLCDCWDQRVTELSAVHTEVEFSFNHQKSLRDIQVVGGGDTSIGRRLRAFVLLAWRAWTEQRRDTFTICVKATITVIFALILGGIYSNIGYSQRSIQNRFGLLFFIVINQMFTNVTAVFNTFPREKTIVNRERANKAYGTLEYFVAKILVEIPLNVLPAIVYAAIIYFLVKLRAGGFGVFVGILMFTNFTGVCLGLAISAGAPSSDAAIARGFPLLIIMNLFGGLYVKISTLPIVLNWIPYVSIIRWGFEGFAINEFTGLTFDCDGASASGCVQTGEQALTTLSFDGHTVSYPMFGLGMCMLTFMAIGFLVLSRSRPIYTNLGHIGNMFGKRRTSASESTIEDIKPAGLSEAKADINEEPPALAESDLKPEEEKSSSVNLTV